MTETLKIVRFGDPQHPTHKGIPTSAEVVVAPDDVAGSIRRIIEKEIGYVIQCGTCIKYLRSITADDLHSDVLLGLLQHAPSPDWWRIKYKTRQAKLARYSELIEPIIPKGEVKMKNLQTILTPTDADWSVVVTTAPRQEPTVVACLNSIRTAGWEPVVFAEPDSYKPEGFTWIDNERKLGAWHNWLRAVRWALDRTTAQYILTVQDDSLFHPDSRKFVEQVMWPSPKTGFLSLYTAKHYSMNLSGDLKRRGINRIETTALWGACALVFPREALIQIINHPIVPGWTGIPPANLSDKQKVELIKTKKENPHLIQNVDSAIGRIINGLHLEMYCIDPSPVHHVATYSSIGHANNNNGKRNCHRCSDHSKPLAEQVFS